MKMIPTAGFATLIAAVIAVAIYLGYRGTHDSPPDRAIALPAPVAQPGLPLDSASPAPPREPNTASVAELTRLTIQALSSADPTVRANGVSQLLPALVKRDATAAARVADLFVDSPLRAEILSAVARGWAEQNRPHALAWAQALPDANEREAALVEILSLVSQSDPAEAVRLRQQFLEGDGDDAELTNLAQRWAESDLSAVLGFADSLPPGAQRDQLTARAAFIQSRSSPAEAAQLVLDRIPQGEAQSEALISVVHQWAQRDLEAASTWVAGIPERLLRERAIEELEAAKRANP